MSTRQGVKPAMNPTANPDTNVNPAFSQTVKNTLVCKDVRRTGGQSIEPDDRRAQVLPDDPAASRAVSGLAPRSLGVVQDGTGGEEDTALLSGRSRSVMGRDMLKAAGRSLSVILAVLLISMPMAACEREQGNPIPKTPPKPRISGQ